MKLKIPSAREPKKRKIEVEVENPTTKIPSFPVCVPTAAPFYKRFWNPAEIVQIIQLQAFLQRQELNLRVRDFEILWDESQGRCALTGETLCSTRTFDVGIERFDKNRPFNRHNSRLVLLPLSYTRVRSCQFGIYVDKIPEKLIKRPTARAILMHFIDELYRHKPTRHYAISVLFCDRGSDMTIRQKVFPITRWYRKHETGDNESHICGVTINDDKQSIEITGRVWTDKKSSYSRWKGETYSFSLYDPTIDYVSHFIKIYSETFKVALADEARRVLEKWDY